MYSDVPGLKVDMWRRGTFLAKLQESEQATDCNHRPQSDWVVDIRQPLQQFIKPPYSCTATPLYIHPISAHVTVREEFYQTFPLISTASNKHWGEKPLPPCWSLSGSSSWFTSMLCMSMFSLVSSCTSLSVLLISWFFPG